MPNWMQQTKRIGRLTSFIVLVFITLIFFQTFVQLVEEIELSTAPINNFIPTINPGGFTRITVNQKHTSTIE